MKTVVPLGARVATSVAAAATVGGGAMGGDGAPVADGDRDAFLTFLRERFAQ